MATAFRTRPSSFLAIDNPFDAYRLDRAVYRFGHIVEQELEGVEGKNKNEIKKKRLRVVDKYFPKAQSASAGKNKKFADPATRS